MAKPLQEATASSAIMSFSTIPWNKDVDDFGLGIAKATQTRKMFAINTDKLETTVIDELPAGNTLAFKSTLARSAKDINEHFEINASASFHANFEEFGGGADALTKHVNNLQQNSDKTILLCSGVKRYTVDYVKNRNLLWSPDKLEIDPKKMTSEKFAKDYGDAFICGVVRGAEFHMSMIVETCSSEDKHDVEYKLSAAMNYLSTEADIKTTINTSLKDIQKNFNTTVHVLVSGVNGLSIRLLPDITNLPEELGSFMEDATPDAAVKIRAVIEEYSALPNFGRFSTDTKAMSARHKEAEMNSKINQIYDYKKRRDHLIHIQKNPGLYVTPDCIYNNRKCSEADMTRYFKNVWAGKLKILDDYIIGIKKYLVDVENAMILPRLRSLWELDIYDEDLPVPAHHQQVYTFGCVALKANKPAKVSFAVPLIGIPDIFYKCPVVSRWPDDPNEGLKITDVTHEGFQVQQTKTKSFNYVAMCDVDVRGRPFHVFDQKSYALVRNLHGDVVPKCNN